MKMNSRMSDVLAGGPGGLPSDLPSDLNEVAKAGWVVGPQRTILLKSLWGTGWRTSIQPSEVGSYEYEVNDVYASLSDLATERSTYLHRSAVRGISFAVRMLGGAAAIPEAELLVAVVSISIDEEDETFLMQGATVRFFSRRGDYPMWFEDLERYQNEAIAVLNMSDLAVGHA
jgi:hypothetical protein